MVLIFEILKRAAEWWTDLNTWLNIHLPYEYASYNPCADVSGASMSINDDAEHPPVLVWQAVQVAVRSRSVTCMYSAMFPLAQYRHVRLVDESLGS